MISRIPMSVAPRRHHRHKGAPFITTGLTAYWNPTQQVGNETGIVETVGGLTATHLGSPTFDATTKLWLYNGTSQASRSSIVAGLNSANYVFTLEAVVAIVSATPNFGHVAGLGASGGVPRFTLQGSSANIVTIVTGQAATKTALGSFGAITHVAMTCDGTTLTLYKNGAVAGTTTVTPPAAANAGASFGNDTSGSAQWANCKAGWMRWYNNTCLTQAQISQNYANAKTLFSALP